MPERIEKPPIRHSKKRGFTLLEVLIAIAIFGLIGIVSSQLLLRVLHAQQLSEARADRLADLQRSVALFERDVMQAADRPIRDEFGDPQPALVLDLGTTLELTRHGWSNPLQLPRSELQRVAWELDEEGRLQRSFWTVLDRAEDSAPVRQTLLTDVRSLEMHLLDADGGSWPSWPVDAGDPLAAPANGLDGNDAEEPEPVALRLTLDVPPFGRIERLLPLPAAVPTLASSLPGTEEEAEGEAVEAPEAGEQEAPADGP